MKTYKVTLHVTAEINADDKDEAIAMFWDDLHTNMEGGEELAIAEEVKEPCAECEDRPFKHGKCHEHYAQSIQEEGQDN